MKWSLAYALLLNLLIFVWFVAQVENQTGDTGFSVGYTAVEAVLAPLLLIAELPEEQRIKKPSLNSVSQKKPANLIENHPAVQKTVERR